MIGAAAVMVSSPVSGVLVAVLALMGSITASAFTTTTFGSHHSTTPAARPSCDGTTTTPSRAPIRHSSAVTMSRRRSAGASASSSPLRMSTAEEAQAPAAVGAQPTRDIPTKLPSECGIDYVPLATMLATGDLKGADQFTRDALIKAAGVGSQKREFVYWTEVKKIPK